MGKQYETLDPGLRGFLEAQHLFFVGTAPLDARGHVNVSPKGLDSFRVVDDSTVAYLDLTGSGAETAAHLRENGRITFLFCAFEGPPRIVRLYGRGEAVSPGDPRWEELYDLFPPSRSARAVILVELDRIADSCGYGVPRYSFVEERTQLPAWTDRKTDEQLREYQREKNTKSIDGLPAYDA